MRRSVIPVAICAVVWAGSPAEAATYVPISLIGSTWAANAIQSWSTQDASSGLTVNYSATGSADGANQFANGTVDGAVVDAQYADGSAGFTTTRSHALVPLAAGAVVFAYQLKTAAGTPVTGLRLSPTLVAKIFSRDVTTWNDPLIAAENPGVALPAIAIVPVVRAENNVASDRVAHWLAHNAPAAWDRLCAAAGQPAACPAGPAFPANPGDVSVTGATGVAGYVMQSANNGAIGFVESSYALNANLPTARLENATGYYRDASAANTAVALQAATADPATGAVDLDQAAASTDPRAYPLTMISYLMAPTSITANFSADKGTTLRTFADSAVCAEQNLQPSLGYVPLTGNLINDALGGIGQIPVAPGAVFPTVCTNLGDPLAASAPPPAPGDHAAPSVEALATILPPGALVISITGDAHVVLPSPVLDSTATDFHTSVQMTPITVTDNRAGSPGWTLSGQVTDFTDGVGHTIGATCLGWFPHLVGGTGQFTTVTAGLPVFRGEGGLKTPHTLASATGLGTTEVGAELDLDAPTTTVAGTYAATLTITAI